MEHTPASVYNIFADFFGEDKVDLQEEERIIIHFPKVRVTNENNKYIDITHLWVKVELCSNGTIVGPLKMIRSEYTEQQFKSGYSHSHLHTIDSYNYKKWSNPCLGSGPIRATISSLVRKFSEEMWNLFCLELSKYVTTESLEGIPYIRLESVETKYRKYKMPSFPYIIYYNKIYENIASQLIPVILSKKPFGFNYSNGSYGIAMSESDIIITLSNIFIEYYNSLDSSFQLPVSQLFLQDILYRGKKIGGELYIFTESCKNRYPISDHIGETLFTFKGENVTLNIIQTTDNSYIDENMSLFLHPVLVATIINKLLSVVNRFYGNPNEQENSSGIKIKCL